MKDYHTIYYHAYIWKTMQLGKKLNSEQIEEKLIISVHKICVLYFVYTVIWDF
jgi:hypothetical protein